MITNDYSFCSDLSKDFPFEEAKKLFEENQHFWMKKPISFEKFLARYPGFVFAGFFQGKFHGIIYYHNFDSSKVPKTCYMSGFAKRHSAIHIKNAINILNNFIIKTYNLETIYTKPANRAAIICDLRAGFKTHKDNILIWKG